MGNIFNSSFLGTPINVSRDVISIFSFYQKFVSSEWLLEELFTNLLTRQGDIFTLNAPSFVNNFADLHLFDVTINGTPVNGLTWVSNHGGSVLVEPGVSTTLKITRCMRVDFNGDGNFGDVIELNSTLQNIRSGDIMNIPLSTLDSGLEYDSSAPLYVKGSVLRILFRISVHRALSEIGEFLNPRVGTAKFMFSHPFAEFYQIRNVASAEPDSAEEIRNKLESLEGNDRLDASAIQGLPGT